MNKYIDADKLIATLERQNVDKKVVAPLIRIIDSLQQEQQEELDKSLEEAAEEYEDWVESYSQSDFPTCVSFRQAFIAGAECQKEQDTREMIKSDGGSFRRCYELGKKDMKEQMMKDAVEFECIGKKVKMTVQELINYYIDAECCEVANECGF